MALFAGIEGRRDPAAAAKGRELGTGAKQEPTGVSES